MNLHGNEVDAANFCTQSIKMLPLKRSNFLLFLILPGIQSVFLPEGGTWPTCATKPSDTSTFRIKDVRKKYFAISREKSTFNKDICSEDLNLEPIKLDSQEEFETMSMIRGSDDIDKDIWIFGEHKDLNVPNCDGYINCNGSILHIKDKSPMYFYEYFTDVEVHPSRGNCFKLDSARKVKTRSCDEEYFHICRYKCNLSEFRICQIRFKIISKFLYRMGNLYAKLSKQIQI